MPVQSGAAPQPDPLPPHSTNVDEEMQRVRLALETIFASPSNVQQQQHGIFQQRQLADRYLTSFQTQQISWMVCDRLLQQGNEQECFFAAQTLHTKCRLDVQELPQDAMGSLRDSLLGHLNRYAAVAAPSAALLTQLALAVSALAVQMNWTTILSDLLANQASHPMLMLSVLTVLPEECASDRLLLQDEHARFQMRDHLVASAPHVFRFLEAQVQLQTARVLQAFWSWIRWVPVHPSSLLDCALLKMSIQTLHQTQFLESAADIVVEVLRMYPSHNRGNETLVQWLIPILSQLPIQDALQSNNEDVLRAYTRVVTEMGESYMSCILAPSSNDHVHERALVESVLQCSTIQSTEIASITLHFWYRMIIDLECIDPYEWREELIAVYEPQILRLIDVCVKALMKYPTDIDDLPDDLVEDLHRHRYYVTETVEDCCRLLGGRVILQRLGDLFRNEVEQLGGTHPQQAEWRGIESCLACFAAIHRFVPSDEASLLPQMFQLIPQLRRDIKPLRFTASKVIGKFASWLSMHPALLQPLLPFLAEGLDIPECAPAAAVAIKELCQSSNQNFVIAEPVMHLYQNIIDSGNAKHLELEDELHILEGLCRALSRQIIGQHSNGSDVLISLANPVGSRLAAAIANPSASARRITPELDRLTIIIQHLTIVPNPGTTHPVIDLMSSTWNLLDQATTRFPADNMLAEKICRLHKHTIRSVGASQYAPVLDALIKQLVTSYQVTRQSPYLYAASIVVTEYGQNPAFATKIFEMVASMASTSFSFLQSIQDMTNHPDVVEELFYLMARVISCCADLLIVNPLLASLFQCAVVAIQLDHSRANKGTVDFLNKTLSYGLSLRERQSPECSASLQNVLTQQGAGLVHNLARALMGDLPIYTNQIPELIWKLNLLCPNLLSQWLASAFGSVAVPERAKNDFMGALSTNLARDEFNLAASAFQSACLRDRRFRMKRRP
ncbi:hypothetical protein MPSEU_000803000 [Mayamaea pseudoterrestris]|nr:hypothetical protein MPSEU_000803000 [Mayamaea pseudoterrestris]